MDIDDLVNKKNRMEQETYAKIQDAIKEIKGDLGSSNKKVAQHLQDLKKATDSEEKTEDVDVSSTQQSQPTSDTKADTTATKKPLLYLSHPLTSEPPAWLTPLQRVLVAAGYLVYNPREKINEQFTQQDLPNLDALSIRLVKSMCQMLYIPEEVLLPFSSAVPLLQKGDAGDNFGIVFQCLWFLARSSLVICDLTQDIISADSSQELLYSKQLQIPVVGLFPTSGYINPFVHRTTTMLFSGTDLLNLMPIIKSYASI